jgi:hypothetical protein
MTYYKRGTIYHNVKNGVQGRGKVGNEGFAIECLT